MNEPRGWYSRGYLPHYDPGATLQTVTYRLADSLPTEVVARLAETRRADAGQREEIERYLDAGAGCCILRDSLADLLVENWRHFNGWRYRLHAYVVMPNHVHLLIETADRTSLSKIVQSWKSYTAKRILADPKAARFFLERRVWQPDFWDRFIRNEAHYRAAIEYIAQNPVKAGLVDRPSAWRWSYACAENGTDGRVPS